MTPIVDWDRLRERFKMLRESRDISQDAVGEAIGKTGQTISEWERGKNKPRLSNFEGACKAIDAELVIEVVSVEDARLVQQLTDLLPWANSEARMFVQQAIKMARLNAQVAREAELAEVPVPAPLVFERDGSAKRRRAPRGTHRH